LTASKKQVFLGAIFQAKFGAAYFVDNHNALLKRYYSKNGKCKIMTIQSFAITAASSKRKNMMEWIFINRIKKSILYKNSSPKL
jgi:hypothetical protein